MNQRVKADLIVRNVGQLITLRDHSSSPIIRPTVKSLGVIQKSEGCSIASASGKICFVGGNSGVSESIDTRSAIEIDAKNYLALPGFVDCHTHSIYAGSREEELSYKISGLSYLDILNRGGGILKTVRETRRASNEELLSAAKLRLNRMISTGTTTFEMKTGYGLSVSEEVRLMELIGQLKAKYGYDIESTLLSAHALPPEYDSTKRYVQEVVLPTIGIASERHLAKFCDVFMERGIFGAREAEHILTYSRSKGLDLKLHADEFYDMGGAALSSRLGVSSADHLLKASQKGKRALARTRTMSVLLPGTALASFSRYAVAREFIDAGAPVALATDQSPNSWVESMQFVISLACYGMKMTPEEAIVGATINGAHAIGRGVDAGSIEVGKNCDLLVTDVKGYEEIPYRIGSNSVVQVIKKGSPVRKI